MIAAGCGCKVKDAQDAIAKAVDDHQYWLGLGSPGGKKKLAKKIDRNWDAIMHTLKGGE